jgi:hypothetical protein
MRVAFVGQATYFESCAMHAPAGGIEPAFVDHRGGADPSPMLAELERLAPEVVVVFRPEAIPHGAFAGLDAARLGFSTEPLPRPGTTPHPELVARLDELADSDPANFDRVVAFDPLSAASVRRVGLPLWRTMPLPVDDRVYAPPRPAAAPPRLLFVGYATPHRERWLAALEPYHLLHAVHGLTGDRLRDVHARTDVAINLHAKEFPSFENRVLAHLASGHLVLSEPLSPRQGLRAGAELIEAHDPDHLAALVGALHRQPDLFDAVRAAGRRAAERFRASVVWPRIVGDLLSELGRPSRSRSHDVAPR